MQSKINLLPQVTFILLLTSKAIDSFRMIQNQSLPFKEVIISTDLLSLITKAEPHKWLQTPIALRLCSPQLLLTVKTLPIEIKKDNTLILLPQLIFRTKDFLKMKVDNLAANLIIKIESQKSKAPLLCLLTIINY